MELLSGVWLFSLRTGGIASSVVARLYADIGIETSRTYTFMMYLMGWKLVSIVPIVPKCHIGTNYVKTVKMVFFGVFVA